MGQDYEFVLDERLGIRTPQLAREWDEYERSEQSAIIAQWEAIRARIPDRVKQLEEQIDLCQLKVAEEDDWDAVCGLYGEIYRIASIINDLNIWNSMDVITSTPEQHADAGLAVEHFNREK